MMSSARRKPKCHTCGNFMEGHRRVHGSPVCPPGYEDQESVATSEKSLISPPPTPDRDGMSSDMFTTNGSSNRARPTPPPNRRLQRYSSPEPLQLHQLPGGALYRRNPNWNDESAYDITRYTSPNSAPKQWIGGRPLRDGSPAPSHVSTVLVDEDGRPIRDDASLTNSDSDFEQNGFDWDDNASSVSSLSSTSEDSSGTFHPHERSDPAYHYPYRRSGTSSWVSKIADYARTNRSAVTVFRAKPKELAKIERTAIKHGVYAATIEPSYGEDDDQEYRSPSKAMVVLGKSASFVHQIAGTGLSLKGERQYRQSFNNNRRQNNNMQQQQGNMDQHPASSANSKVVTFMQLLLASIIGGCIVMYGMSHLQQQAASTTRL